MELWFTERQTEGLAFSCRVTKTLHREKTPFQELAMLDTEQFGKMLVLDGAIQTSILDEFTYHEMIAHVPLFTHPSPRRVLVIGGGDGGTVREALKHPWVERIDLVEIDQRVIEVAQEHLLETSYALSDPRVNVVIRDGIAYVKGAKAEYDVVIVDSSDPVGPAVGLFSRDFYEDVFEALREDGLFTAQTESPFFNRDLIKRVYSTVSSIFPITRLYLTNVPTYPSGLWSFVMGSKVYDPFTGRVDRPYNVETRYYTHELHRAAFTLPRFVKQILLDANHPTSILDVDR